MKWILKKVFIIFAVIAIVTAMTPVFNIIVSAGNAAINSQTGSTAVNVTKVQEGFKINITGWVSNYKYQIWSYQKVTSDFVLGGKTGAEFNQWVLSQAYTLGSAGALQTDGSIDFLINDFVSNDSNYTISVRILDNTGKYVGEVMDSYTPAEVQEVKITKVLVDGAYAKDTEVKEIKTSAAVLINPIGNNITGTVYSARVSETGTSITVNNTNEFSWDISALTPGNYTIVLSATNGTTTDRRTLKFKLYSVDNSIKYGEISKLDISAGSSSALPKSIGINPSFTNGKFYYSVSEPGRAAMFTSGLFSSTDTIAHSITKYGIYEISGFVNRDYEVRIGNAYDDGFVKTLTVSRSQTEPSSETLTANVNLKNPVAKNTEVKFTANAVIGGIGATPVQYSFWRYDANGYALIKDWSSDNTLSWTPARVGMYTIEVRAKGADAGSFEVTKSVKVTVTDAVQQIAKGVSISINTSDLNKNSLPRVPVTIVASATSTNSEDLLYKFNVTDDAMGTYTIQQYSANQECIWTPRKAGSYTISVLVKNMASFGTYDAMKSFVVNVKEPMPTVFNYLLFSGSNTATLTLGGTFNIYGSVHSNYNLAASPAKGYISGAAEASGTASINTWTCTVGKLVSGAPFIPMTDFTSCVSQVVPTTWENTPTVASINAMFNRVMFNGNTKIIGNVKIQNGCTISGNLYVDGDLTISGGSPVCILNSGSIYATGSITFNNTFSGDGCIFAGGNISFTGASNAITPNKLICLYSRNGNIAFAPVSNDVYGLIYAPSGSVSLGGNNITFHGNIIAKTISGLPSKLTMYSNSIALPFTIG